MSIECEQLFSAPQYTQVKLAHDGRSVFYIRNDSGRKLLYKYNLSSRTTDQVSIIGNGMKLFDVFEDDNFYYLTEEKGYLNTLYINDRNCQHKIRFEDSNIKV